MEESIVLTATSEYAIRATFVSQLGGFSLSRFLAAVVLGR